MFGLVSVLLDKGDVAGARELWDRLAAVAADRPDVLWLGVRIALAEGDADAARRRVLRLLANPGLTSEQRAEADLSLGLASDMLGAHADAFGAAARGKRVQRVLHAAVAASREGEVAKLRRLDAWLNGRPANERWDPPPSGEAAATHVFLLGFPRSGTTLLEQVLASHPRVAALEEAPTLAAAYQAFLVDAEAVRRLEELDADDAARWAAHYWRGVKGRGVNVAGRTFVDKQPAGTLYLPLIARLFPRARILFAIRDPRDVVLSCFRQPFAMNAMTYAFTDLAETAACYDACMALADTARTRLDLAWADTRHEALIDDFDGELARILCFIGLNCDAAMADFARGALSRTIRTPSAAQVRAGLNRRGIGRWRQYREALQPVLPVLAPWVGRFGYPA